jgi:nucleoside-diphosphate-sugar epimerase
MKNHLLIFGYGYTARTIARILNKGEWDISATSRSKTSDKYCTILRYNELEIKEVLKNATHILISIPPNDKGDVVFQKFGKLITNCKNIKWIGYFSSTAVYGNHNGGWVDETTDTSPSSRRGENRKLAENQWLELKKVSSIPVNIFRLSGIYGPNRNALSQIKAGRAVSINKKHQVFSRVHVSDISQTVEAAMNMRLQSEVFNVTDDYPCSSIEVNNYAASILKTNSPKVIDFAEADLSKMAKEFYNDNRRVSNKKIKEKLSIILKFPTYREGIDRLFQFDSHDNSNIENAED